MFELFGFIWAIFAPLMLLLPGYWAYSVAGRLPWAKSRKRQVLIAAAATFGVVMGFWLRDVAQFDRQCAINGPAQIFEKRQVDGIFLDDSTANSFGTRYLYDEGFTWMEARSIYNRQGFTRYEKTADGISQKETDRITAMVTVKSEHSTDDISSTTRITITDIPNGKLLASASSSNFNGGSMRWVLGAWGTRSCPAPGTTLGSEEFNRYHHLAKLTLR